MPAAVKSYRSLGAALVLSMETRPRERSVSGAACVPGPPVMCKPRAGETRLRSLARPTVTGSFCSPTAGGEKGKLFRNKPDTRAVLVLLLSQRGGKMEMREGGLAATGRNVLSGCSSAWSCCDSNVPAAHGCRLERAGSAWRRHGRGVIKAYTLVYVAVVAGSLPVWRRRERPPQKAHQSQGTSTEAGVGRPSMPSAEISPECGQIHTPGGNLPTDVWVRQLVSRHAS